MKFRSYDSLKIFDAVARKQSMTAAAIDLNLSKGSISYQINKLEENLGFALFERNMRAFTSPKMGEEYGMSL